MIVKGLRINRARGFERGGHEIDDIADLAIEIAARVYLRRPARDERRSDAAFQCVQCL